MVAVRVRQVVVLYSNYYGNSFADSPLVLLDTLLSNRDVRLSRYDLNSLAYSLFGIFFKKTLKIFDNMHLKLRRPSALLANE